MYARSKIAVRHRIIWAIHFSPSFKSVLSREKRAEKSRPKLCCRHLVSVTESASTEKAIPGLCAKITRRQRHGTNRTWKGFWRLSRGSFSPESPPPSAAHTCIHTPGITHFFLSFTLFHTYTCSSWLPPPPPLWFSWRQNKSLDPATQLLPCYLCTFPCCLLLFSFSPKLPIIPLPFSSPIYMLFLSFLSFSISLNKCMTVPILFQCHSQ